MRGFLYYFFTASLFLYLISCTSSDQKSQSVFSSAAKVVKVGLGKIDSQQQIIDFDQFLTKISKEELIMAADEDLHQLVTQYFPDSTIAKGYDLHAHEIGGLDTFRLVFYEYFDLYESWSNTYLGIYSPRGEVLDIKKLWEVSFEGNISINLIDAHTLEIAYYDIFTKASLQDRPLVSNDHFYLQPFSRRRQSMEGYVYEYYKINTSGQLSSISQSSEISIDRKFPQASAQLLAKEELISLPIETLQLMQQEVLADHGMIFPDENSQNYFEHQKWYEPREYSVDEFLSDIEKMNLRLLEQLQAEQY